VTVPRDEAHEGESKLLIPKKTLHELSRLVVDDETVVSVEQAENHFFFHIGERLLISRKREGQFPSYERVIPKGNDKRVEFDRDRLMSAVRRVALLSNERSRAVKLAIDKNKVDVTSSSPEFGEAHELLTVDYAGQAMQICFNAQYVVDFLNVVDTDTVALELKDEVSQAVMRPVNAEGYDYTYVIMPMRI
jgi:DNA polymerase-3 subunit beta